MERTKRPALENQSEALCYVVGRNTYSFQVNHFRSPLQCQACQQKIIVSASSKLRIVCGLSLKYTVTLLPFATPPHRSPMLSARRCRSAMRCSFSIFRVTTCMVRSLRVGYCRSVPSSEPRRELLAPVARHLYCTVRLYECQ